MQLELITAMNCIVNAIRIEYSYELHNDAIRKLELFTTMNCINDAIRTFYNY